MEHELKIGDMIHSTTPNIHIEKFNKANGLIGKLLSISEFNIFYKVEVDTSKYPFYTGSCDIGLNKKYVYCSKVTKINRVQQFKIYI